MILTTIQQFFKQHADNSAADTQRLSLAAACLLVEVMTIDQHIDEREEQQLQCFLAQQCHLDTQKIHDIIQLAKQQSAQSVDLYQFTHCINQYYHYQEKYQLLVFLWRIAFADGVLDKYEEALIRKISDLLYLPHRDFIKAKQQARQLISD